MTVLLPDPNSREWKDLGLIRELEENGCNKTNSKKKCPRIRRFLAHHLVDSSPGKEGNKEENQVWEKDMVGIGRRLQLHISSGGADIGTTRGFKW